jgi:hypothetical protein
MKSWPNMRALRLRKSRKCSAFGDFGRCKVLWNRYERASDRFAAIDVVPHQRERRASGSENFQSSAKRTFSTRSTQSGQLRRPTFRFDCTDSRSRLYREVLEFECLEKTECNAREVPSLSSSPPRAQHSEMKKERALSPSAQGRTSSCSTKPRTGKSPICSMR